MTPGSSIASVIFSRRWLAGYRVYSGHTDHWFDWIDYLNQPSWNSSTSSIHYKIGDFKLNMVVCYCKRGYLHLSHPCWPHLQPRLVPTSSMAQSCVYHHCWRGQIDSNLLPSKHCYPSRYYLSLFCDPTLTPVSPMTSDSGHYFWAMEIAFQKWPWDWALFASLRHGVQTDLPIHHSGCPDLSCWARGLSSYCYLKPNLPFDFTINCCACSKSWGLYFLIQYQNCPHSLCEGYFVSWYPDPGLGWGSWEDHQFRLENHEKFPLVVARHGRAYWSHLWSVLQSQSGPRDAPHLNRSASCRWTEDQLRRCFFRLVFSRVIDGYEHGSSHHCSFFGDLRCYFSWDFCSSYFWGIAHRGADYRADLSQDFQEVSPLFFVWPCFSLNRSKIPSACFWDYFHVESWPFGRSPSIVLRTCLWYWSSHLTF